MSRFVNNLALFAIPIVLLFTSGLFLPATPRASKSLLFANLQKDSLLQYTSSPRIIFIGGSNLSLGLNSKMINDSLSINPINTGVHANVGIKYMLENTLKYIRNGDIIILALEYSHFFRSYEMVPDELLRTVCDVSPDKIKILSLQQKVSILSYLPKFSLTKFKPSEYFGYKEDEIYGISSFNEYGDVDAHWNLEKRNYIPSKIKGKFEDNVILKIKEFEKCAKNKGGVVYLTFPPLDEVSYQYSKKKIDDVEKSLKDHSFIIIGSAKSYIMASNNMFDSHYHLLI